mmetsp:Transcript_27731/g.50407  ORF Transcript_27731/g.50407 Transcript_27731/m.50407 type:complete len:520 (-) Transcript_27731:138-1697(-)
MTLQPLKTRILIVDDSKSSLKLTDKKLRSILSFYRLEEEVGIDLASDGLEAISKIDKISSIGESYSLVLLDVVMPRANGLDVAKFARVSAYHGSLMPIVALSGIDEADWPSSQGAGPAGLLDGGGSAVTLFDGALLKPITTSALAPLIACFVLPAARHFTPGMGKPRRHVSLLREQLGSEEALLRVCESGAIRGLLAVVNNERGPPSPPSSSTLSLTSFDGASGDSRRHTGGLLTILVAENSPVHRKLLARQLKSALLRLGFSTNIGPGDDDATCPPAAGSIMVEVVTMENDMKSVKRRIGKSVAGRRKREYEKLNNGDRQKRPRSKRPQAPSHGHVRVEDDYQGEEEEEERVEENGEDESGFDDSNREFVLVVVDTGARDVLEVAAVLQELSAADGREEEKEVCGSGGGGGEYRRGFQGALVVTTTRSDVELFIAGSQQNKNEERCVGGGGGGTFGEKNGGDGCLAGGAALLDFGVKDCLCKPCKPEDTLKLVSQWVAPRILKERGVPVHALSVKIVG